MKKLAVFLPLILIVFLCQACSYNSTINCPPTPNVQETVDAAVAFTCGALLHLQGEESDLSTDLTNNIPAMPLEFPTPEPAKPYETMTALELGALLNERVQLAGKAADIAASQSLQAGGDGDISQKELDLLYTYWSYAVDMVAYAQEPLDVYKTTYAELAVSTNPLLQKIDTNLQNITQEQYAIYGTLEQIGQLLWQGGQAAPADAQNLNAIAARIQILALDVQGQGITWSTNLSAEVQARVDQALAVKSKTVPKTRKAAILRSYDYFDVVKAALKDHTVTQEELSKIAQKGATAVAGLTQQGGEKFHQLAGQVNQITAQIAGGQIRAAQASLEAYKTALPKKPQ